MSKEIENAVSELLAVNGVVVNVSYLGVTNRDGWECDAWRVFIRTGTVEFAFEYFTGLCHRKASARDKANLWRQYPLAHNPNATREYRANYLHALEKAKKPVAPHVTGLLYSLIAEQSACEQSFSEWCGEFGYDTDSRQTLHTYEACQENADKYRKLFSRDMRKKLADLLQDY